MGNLPRRNLIRDHLDVRKLEQQRRKYRNQDLSYSFVLQSVIMKSEHFRHLKKITILFMEVIVLQLRLSTLTLSIILEQSNSELFYNFSSFNNIVIVMYIIDYL